MMILLKWLVTALALLLVAQFVPGIEVDSFTTAVFAAFIFGIVNITIRPLLWLLTLPINLLTLGLFSFVLNALMFLLVANIIEGFSVDGFFSALLGSIIVSLIASLVNSSEKQHD